MEQMSDLQHFVFLMTAYELGKTITIGDGGKCYRCVVMSVETEPAGDETRHIFHIAGRAYDDPEVTYGGEIEFILRGGDAYDQG